MPNPIIGGTGVDDYQPKLCLVSVYRKASWGDNWIPDPELEFLNAKLNSAGQGQSSCELRRRFGIVKQPYGSAPAIVSPADYLGHFVMITMQPEGGTEKPQWVGKITNCADEIGGNQAKLADPANPGDYLFEGIPTGDQVFTSYGGLEYLDKINIYESWWSVRTGAGDEVEEAPREKKLDWIPSINQRDRLNTIVGNRSADTYTNNDVFDPTHIYGGDQVWTFKSYIEYVLARFVNSLEGPRFELDGDVAFIDELESNVKFDKSIFRGLQRGSLNVGSTTSAGAILRTLINPQFGLDFVIVPEDTPNPDGGKPDYKIRIFALSGETVNFEGVSLPENANLVDVDPSAGGSSVKYVGNPQVIDSADHRYDKIVILGDRVVTCCTLRSDQEDEKEHCLIKKWTDELAAEYKNPSEAIGGSDAEKNDTYRRDEIFEPVYQFFGAPPYWNLQKGAAAPGISDAGVPAAEVDDEPGEGTGPDGEELTADQKSAFQNIVRETLPWVPLRKSTDYSVYPPVPFNNVDNFESDYRAPIVLVLDETLSRYQYIEHYQISVHVPRNDWGIFINPNPNHRLAYRHWDGTGPVGSDNTIAAAATNNDPEFDWEKLLVTIAFPSDHRFRMSYTLPGQDIQGTKVIEVPDAELWYAAPKTVVGISPLGQPVEIHEDNLVLRNDSERMYAVMAAAISRYFAERRRCRVPVVEVMAWADLVGKMLWQYHSTSGSGPGATSHSVDIKAPITGIEWQGSGSPRSTTILAGLVL